MIRRLLRPITGWAFDYITDIPLENCPQRLIALRMAHSGPYIEVEPAKRAGPYTFRLEYYTGSLKFERRTIFPPMETKIGVVGELLLNVVGTRVLGYVDTSSGFKWFLLLSFIISVVIAHVFGLILVAVSIPVIWYEIDRKQRQALAALHQALPPVAQR